jgi:twitching motility protein PilT
MNVDDMLKRMVEKRSSDLILRVASAPMLRIDGNLFGQDDFGVLNQEILQAVFEQIASVEQRAHFAKELELDLAYGIAGVGRFRVNVMRQRGTLGFTFRLVPFKIPTIEELNLPAICKDLILKPRGLILVTGPTGSGKSTTMAAMIDYLNERESRNIITI